MLFLAARQSPIQTPLEAVQHPLDRLKIVLDMESHSYRQCALDSAVAIQYELQIAAQNEHDRVSAIHEANRVVIEKARQRKETCFESAKKAQSLLRQWHDNGSEVESVLDPQVCSVDQRAEMDQLLGGDFKLLEEEVTSLWERRFQDTVLGFQSIQDYAEARFHYDYEYFVGHRIQPALDLIDALPNFQAPDLSIEYIALRDRVSEALLRLQNALHRAEIAIETLKANLTQLSGNLDAFYTAYVDVYDRLVKGARFVQDVLPPGVPMPNFLDITMLPIADSMMPSFNDVWMFEFNVGSIYPLISDTVELCMAIIQEVINDLMAQSEHALRGATMKIADALTSVLQLEEYNPPVFIGSQGELSSLGDEVEFQANLGRTALEQTRILIARIANLEVREDGPSHWNIPLEDGDDSLPDDGTTFAYLSPKFPSLFFPKVLALLVFLGSTSTWILDVIIQALRLWKLEDTYSKAAIPDLPEITYDRSTRDPNGEVESKTGQMILSILLKTVFVPRMFTALIVVPVLCGAAAFWYPHLKARCEDTRDGTFLAIRLIAPILVNEASTPGNAYYLMAERQCYRTQRQICRQMQAQTIARYQADYSAFSELQSELFMSVQVMETMKGCVGESTTKMIEDSCCGIKNFAPCANTSAPGFCSTDDSEELEISFQPLEEQLREPACNEKFPQLDLVQPSFECEKLSRICEEIPCEGVDKVALVAETVETDCEIEYFCIRVIFLLFRALCNAIAVSLVSTLLFQGIRILRWRTLYPEGICFRTMMREDGSLSEGSCQDDRANRISKAIRGYEFAGRLQIYAGSFVFLVWAVSAFR